MSGVLDAIDAAVDNKKPIERSAKLILRADLDIEWRQLQASLDAAARQDERDGSLARPFPNTEQVVERMEEIREAVQSSEVEFWFGRLDWTKRLALIGQHPPREGNLLDLSRGYNLETFIPALIKAAFRRAVAADGSVDETIDDTRWDALLGPVEDGQPLLSADQIQDLFFAADSQNTEAPQVPPSARFLLETPASEASSRQPETGKESPPSDSTAGSPPGSPRTSTTTTDGSSEA